MAHYTWYNLSLQGKQNSSLVFQFLALLSEAFIFSYLGLTFFSYNTSPWSTDLIILEIVIIMVGRGIGTIGLYSLLKLCGYEKDSRDPLTFKELAFIWYAGMIRGAIAFGLVLRIKPEDSSNLDVIVTTCLSLVVITTVFFGSTVGVLRYFLFDKEKKVPEQFLEKVDSDITEHEFDLHPNLHPSETTQTPSVLFEHISQGSRNPDSERY